MRPEAETPDALIEARRRFLASCGKFAVATPPAVALMLAATERNYAVAASGTGGGSIPRQGNNGFGNGGGDGVPGRSGDNKSPNAGEKRSDHDR
jgi:hypothetical protein